jgi:hypothetical protein
MGLSDAYQRKRWIRVASTSSPVKSSEASWPANHPITQQPRTARSKRSGSLEAITSEQPVVLFLGRLSWKKVHQSALAHSRTPNLHYTNPLSG